MLNPASISSGGRARQDDRTNDCAKCKAFRFCYRVLTDPDDGQNWPRGHTNEESKLCASGKFLVPAFRVPEPCKGWHPNMMHPRVKKQALEMQCRFKVNEIGLNKAIK